MKKSIQLPDYEYTRLRRAYREEFENTISRLKQLEEILSTFDEDHLENKYTEVKEKKVKVVEKPLENSVIQPEVEVATEKKQDSPVKILKKRGRKPKHVKELELKLAQEQQTQSTEGEQKEVKRRGRPKGKKSNVEANTSTVDIDKFNWRKFIKSNITSRNKFIDSSELLKTASGIYQKYGLSPEQINDKVNSTINMLVNEKTLTISELNGSNHIGLLKWMGEDGNVMVKYNPYDSLEKEKKKGEAINFINNNPLALEIKSEILYLINNNPVKNQLVITSEFYEYIIREKKIVQNNSEIETKGLIDHVLDLLIRTEEIVNIPLNDGSGVQYGLKHWFKKGNGELKSYYMVR